MRGERAERKMKRFKERDRQTGRRQRRQNRRAEQRRGEFILMMVQTSGIKHLELKYQACNYKKKTLLLHLVFYSSV